jgi:SAM-dependent methyltransferase
MDELFLSSLLEDNFIEAVSARAALPHEQVRRRLVSHIGEARASYAVILPRLNREDRVLEIGAGMGLVARELAGQGFKITALEPCGLGFDLFHHVRSEVAQRFGYNGLNWLTISVDELEPGTHGPFDFIFSWHVLEHVPNLRSAISSMGGVKADGGQMLHICPNYRIPYDPHIGVPTLPFAPKVTSLMFNRRVSQKRDVWRSLNFVTAGRVRRICRDLGLSVKFERGAMDDAFRRMEQDPVFAARHNNFLIRNITAARRLLDRIGPAWQSPMTVCIR